MHGPFSHLKFWRDSPSMSPPMILIIVIIIINIIINNNIIIIAYHRPILRSLSVCLSICLSKSGYQSAYMSICPFLCLFICLSVCRSGLKCRNISRDNAVAPTQLPVWLLGWWIQLRQAVKDWQITTDVQRNLNWSETRTRPTLGSLQLLFNWHKHPSKNLWVAGLYLFQYL